MHMIEKSMKCVCVCARVPHLPITMCRCCSVPEFTQGANKWNISCEGTAGWQMCVHWVLQWVCTRGRV